MKFSKHDLLFIPLVFFASALWVNNHPLWMILMLGGFGYYYVNVKLEMFTPRPSLALGGLEKQVNQVAPMSSADFCKAVHEIIGQDPHLDVVVNAVYELENLSKPPEAPKVRTDIEVARYRDKAAAYINNASHTDLVPAVAEALRPLVLSSEQGVFIAKRPLQLKDVEHLAERFSHPEYFGAIYRRLSANQEKAKTVNDYVQGTPFEWLKDRAVGINLTNRFAHTHIMGTTGAGKTQLIQYLITRDLEEDCCVIVIDNQRQMIPKLANLQADTQYISPHDPLEINLFDMPSDNTTASLLRYVLGGIMNAPLTPMQNNIFQFAVELVIANRGGIVMFQQILEGKLPDLSKVDDFVRNFFEGEYQTNKEYRRRANEIGWRVTALLSNPVLRKMFIAKENKCKLDLSKDMILIDTDAGLLQEFSGIFGRFFIAQLLQTAQSRFRGQHRPVYIYIDEFYYYLDESLTSMLETARKAKIGVTLANQFMKQIKDERISSAVMALTNTKFASNLNQADLQPMAKAMRVDKEFIEAQKTGHFALYQSDQETVSIEVEFGYLEKVVGDEPSIPSVRRTNRKPNKQTTEEEREERFQGQMKVYRQLPEHLKGFYSSDEATAFNGKMQDRYSLSKDQLNIYMDISGDVGLGLFPLSELCQKLQDEIGLELDQAEALEWDITNQLTPLIAYTTGKRVPMSSSEDDDITPSSEL